MKNMSSSRLWWQQQHSKTVGAGRQMAGTKKEIAAELTN